MTIPFTTEIGKRQIQKESCDCGCGRVLVDLFEAVESNGKWAMWQRVGETTSDDTDQARPCVYRFGDDVERFAEATLL